MDARFRARWEGRQLRPMPRFVIFAQGRSGSTLLSELLHSSPRVFCDGEILQERVADPAALIASRRRRQLGRAYGYKVKIYQLTDAQGVEDVGGWLRAQHDAGWKVLALRRRNVVRQVVSNLEATRRGEQFHQRGEAPVRAPLVIEPDVLYEWSTKRRRLGELEDAALAGVPHLSLSYEDDLLDADRQQRTLDRALEWLGLPAAEARTTLRRINLGSLDDLVANASEVRAALAGTPLAPLWD